MPQSYSNRPMPTARARLPFLLMTVAALAGCAGKPNLPPEPASPLSNWTVRQQTALSNAHLLPADTSYQSHYLQWHDASRQRQVQAKLYLPPNAAFAQPVPLVVFSHGIGGSREGYSYLGKNWAAQGYASLHVQHEGSDNRLWTGNPLALVARMHDAAQESEALNRVHDLRFALDQVLASTDLAPRLDATRIVAAGHSYGANTVLLAAGAVVQRPSGPVQLRDSRLRAAIIISAPPFHGEAAPQSIVKAIAIPTLHITATGDDIRIPGYVSSYEDRVRLFEQIGSTQKTLAVYREGSHSMFTDRLNTGGQALNPKVKAATLALTLAFFGDVLAGQKAPLAAWPAGHLDLLARFEPNGSPPTALQ
jgi:predicted dienelactone hydrolase